VGIAYVSQELSLIPGRTVLDNVFAGRLPSTLGLVRRRRAEAQLTEMSDRTGISLDPSRLVGELNLADQTYVEILRALAGEARMVILDEPTTAMSPDQTEKVLKLARDLADQGMAIVLVSHALEDVVRVSDRISVLRDGRHVGTHSRGDLTVHELIREMIGRELTDLYPIKVPSTGPTVLRAEGISRGTVVRDVSLDVRAGEVLGIGGLVGSGRSELLRSILGADRADAGRVFLNGVQVSKPSPRRMRELGVVLVPEDRKSQGLHLDHSILRNLVLPYLNRVSSLAVMRRPAERSRAEKSVRDFNVKTGSIDVPVRTLSGGNQQRILFAKWLSGEPSVLMVDEPTRGVDIAGKRAIYDLIRDYAASGGAVIVVSSELPELLGLSHRIAVMAGGRIVAELTGDDMTEINVVSAAFGKDSRVKKKDRRRR
jgi:ABC-type sugar transport system ATPase subunit